MEKNDLLSFFSAKIIYPRLLLEDPQNDFVEEEKNARENETSLKFAKIESYFKEELHDFL